MLQRPYDAIFKKTMDCLVHCAVARDGNVPSSLKRTDLSLIRMSYPLTNPGRIIVTEEVEHLDRTPRRKRSKTKRRKRGGKVKRQRKRKERIRR
jgi:hypothetical protein